MVLKEFTSRSTSAPSPLYPTRWEKSPEAIRMALRLTRSTPCMIRMDTSQPVRAPIAVMTSAIIASSTARLRMFR